MAEVAGTGSVAASIRDRAFGKARENAIVGKRGSWPTEGLDIVFVAQGDRAKASKRVCGKHETWERVFALQAFSFLKVCTNSTIHINE